MKESINLSSHWLSAAFWNIVLEGCYQQLPKVLPAIFANHERCERFRAGSGYNTGSISVASGVCLYAVCRHFQVSHVTEIGTFIGKSTSSIALALAQNGPDGVIHTCDRDNACFEPWDGFGCRVRSFPRKTSTEMLTELAKTPEKTDLFYFDGRIEPADMPLIGQLSHPGTLYAFDDFEGTEKGVANAAYLRASLDGYIVIEPCAPELLRQYGIQGRSLTALLFNTDNILLTNQ
jgi:predicted O-methyltransferase YrrM